MLNFSFNGGHLWFPINTKNMHVKNHLKYRSYACKLLFYKNSFLVFFTSTINKINDKSSKLVTCFINDVPWPSRFGMHVLCE
jgi:hypothetical protein